MFNIVTFIIVYIMLGVSNGSAMSLIREDNQFGIKGTNHQLLLLPKYQLPNLDHLKVATLNQTGFMKSSLDIFSQKFILLPRVHKTLIVHNLVEKFTFVEIFERHII